MRVEHKRVAAWLLLVLSPTAIVAQSSDAGDESYSRKGADTCLSCHQDDTTIAIFSTVHAVPSDSRGPFGHGQLQCEACHGPGGDHAGRVPRGQQRPALVDFDASDLVSIEIQNSRCTDCHVKDVGIGWHSGPHGADQMACTDCHESHARVDAVMQVATQADVCANCHQLQRNETLKAFAHPIFEEKMNCTSCHGMHDDSVAGELSRAALNDSCFECHADKRGPYLWEHAPASEDCGLCHAAHGSNHPGMLTQRPPLLCQACHSQSGHPAVAYGTDGLADNVPSQFLLGQSCMNCHSQVHGSNHPSGSKLMR